MVMIGFKENWKKFPEETEEYFKALQTAFDMRLAVGILRVEGGMDISAMIGDNEKLAEVYRKQSDQSISSLHSEDNLDFPLTESRAESIDSGIDNEVKGLDTLSKKIHEEDLAKKKRKKIVMPMEGVTVDEAMVDNIVQFRNKASITGT